MPSKTHQYSVEQIYHFQCYDCRRPWSIVDWKNLAADAMTYCPWCGARREATLKENEFATITLTKQSCFSCRWFKLLAPNTGLCAKRQELNCVRGTDVNFCWEQ